MDTTLLIKIVLPLIIIQALLIIVSLVDLKKVKSTNGPKWIWMLIIIFISTIGPLLYFTVGRKNNL